MVDDEDELESYGIEIDDIFPTELDASVPVSHFLGFITALFINSVFRSAAHWWTGIASTMVHRGRIRQKHAELQAMEQELKLFDAD